MPDTPTPEDGATPTETPEAPEPTTADLDDPGKKALDAERKARRDAERARKDAEKELQKLREQSMGEQERAIAQARQEATAEAAKAFGGRLVVAEVKAAAAGRQVDVDALLDGLDRTKFLGDDGEPDRDAITSWVDRISPKPTTADGPPQAQVIDIGQGDRGTPALNSPQIVKDLEKALGISG